MKHAEHNTILPNQHGFRLRHSCESQLIIMTEDLTVYMNAKEQVDMQILASRNSFNTVALQQLVRKWIIMESTKTSTIGSPTG